MNTRAGLPGVWSGGTMGLTAAQVLPSWAAPFKIEALDFFIALDAWTGVALEDAAVCYDITNGVPAYVEKIDPAASLEENVERQFLDPSGYLFEEPGNLLLQECRNPEQYDAIVQAIAQGRSKVAEIASATGIAASRRLAIGAVRRRAPLRHFSATEPA